jgi:hypothetical protein
MTGPSACRYIGQAARYGRELNPHDFYRWDAERDGIHVNLKDYLAHVRVSSIGTRPWRRHTDDELRAIYAPKKDVAATKP